MTPEQRNFLIIAIVAVALIAGGIFYSKKKDTPPLTPPSYTTPSDQGSETPPPQGGEESQLPSPPNVGGALAPSEGGGESLKIKFDVAMSNASKAMLAGNYTLALKYYNDALAIKKADVVYSGMFNVYSAQQNWIKAEEVINKAIVLNSKYTEYWKWKLTLLDERTLATYAELKKIYEEGLLKGDSRTKINLVTHFALIAEANGQGAETITLWEYAKELNPSKASIYQAEIDRLRSL